jgi:hypothetical protein
MTTALTVVEPTSIPIKKFLSILETASETRTGRAHIAPTSRDRKEAVVPNVHG